MTTSRILKQPFFIGFYWGIAGGILLVLSFFFTYNVLLQILPYPVILISALLTIKYTCTTKIFRSLFIAGFITFMIMSLILYIYILRYNNPNSGISFTGHLWRFGVILASGSVCSLLLSFLARPVGSVRGPQSTVHR
jgi:hypothetical protein